MITIPIETWAKIHKDIEDIADNGYGSVHITIQNGEVVLVEKTEQYKPPVDNSMDIVKTLVKLTI
jgi:hypothetical protein